MAHRLILDTGIVIAIKRRKVDLGDVYRDQDDVAIAAVTVAELVFGSHLAPNPSTRDDWRAHAERMATSMRVLPYTSSTAVRHGELLAVTRAAGAPRGALDLVIAAHAAETGRVVVTRDRAARFGDLPGVRAVVLD